LLPTDHYVPPPEVQPLFLLLKLKYEIFMLSTIQLTLLNQDITTGCARDRDLHRQKYQTPNFLGFFGFVKTIKLLITQKKI
jgi:hypothetical protein